MGDALRRIQRIQRRGEGLHRLAPQEESQSTDLARYRDDPVGLALDFFGLQLDFSGYTKQGDLCRAAAKFSRVACRSGHKTGKTLSIALLAWWFALTRPDVRVICTHPTARQVKETIWREIRRLRTLAAKRGHELPMVPLDPSTGISLPNGSQILGFTVDDPDAFSGISAPEVLYLADEASGISDAVFEAMAGNLAGGGKLVETGNPTTTSGHFYDNFHEKRHVFKPGALLAISSLESPNILAGRVIVPGLAATEWAEQMAAEYGGPGDPVYDVRVLGEFPSSGPNVVVPLSSLEGALTRYRDDDFEPDDGALCLGIDVARYGDDDTVIAGLRGNAGGIYQTIHGAPVPMVAGSIVNAVRELRYEHEPVRIAIDEGGLGAGVVDLVIAAFEDDDAVAVIGVNAAQSPVDGVRFELARDEMWWGCREWLVTGAIEPNPNLERELVAPTYQLSERGKIKVEPQKAIKKRLKRSPDHANALALAIYAANATASSLSDTYVPQPTSRWAGLGGRGF